MSDLDQQSTTSDSDGESTVLDQSFPPAQRFHNQRDYGRVFYRQQKAAGRHVVVLVAPRPVQAKASRLGIMVSTKVHKRAVRRHQLKRWVREWFRTHGKQVAHGWDVAVLFRSDPPESGHRRLVDDLNRLLTQAIAAPAQPGSGQGRRRGKGKKG